MKTKIKFFLVIQATLILSGLSLFAQYGSFGTSDAQNNGMGNTIGRAYNTLAIGMNPAFLAYPKDTASLITIQIPNFSVVGGIDAMSWDDFLTYFDNPKSKDLTDVEKNGFYNAFSDEPGVFINGGLRLFALSWTHSKEVGTIALSKSYYGGLNSSLPKDLVSFMINGNKPNSTLNFNDLSLNFWALSSWDLSYAREIIEFDDESIIKNITGGITFKLVSGFSYIGFEKFEGSLHTGEYNELTLKMNMLAQVANSPDMGGKQDFEGKMFTSSPGLFMEPAGSGFGVDLGFATDFKFGLQAGLSITDIGSITWDQRAGEYSSDTTIFADDINDFKGADKSIPTRLYTEFLNGSYNKVGSFSTSLPTALRLSLAYDLVRAVEDIPGELLLCLDYHQGFNKMPGNSTTPRIGFGMRWWNGPYIPVFSTGFTNDYTGNLRWGFGFGWSSSVIDINLATQDLLTLFGSSSAPFVSLGMNFIWKISY